MPPQKDAIMMYNTRTIKHVNTTLSITNNNSSFVKNRVTSHSNDPELIHRKLYPRNLQVRQRDAYKSLAFFIQRALRKRLDCFLK